MKRRTGIVGISLLLCVLAAFARAQAPATTQSASGPTIDPKAAAVLHKMADFYKATKSASAKVDTQIKTTFDFRQASASAPPPATVSPSASSDW